MVPASVPFVAVVDVVAAHCFLHPADAFQTDVVEDAVVADHCFLLPAAAAFQTDGVVVVPVSVPFAALVAVVADHCFSHPADAFQTDGVVVADHYLPDPVDEQVYSLYYYYQWAAPTCDCCYHFRC